MLKRNITNILLAAILLVMLFNIRIFANQTSEQIEAATIIDALISDGTMSELDTQLKFVTFELVRLGDALVETRCKMCE